MADPQQKGGPSVQRRWASRLVDRLTLLLSILVVFLVLTAIGQVSLLAAVLAYAAVLALAALIPGAVEIADPSAVSSEAGHFIRDNAVRLYKLSP